MKHLLSLVVPCFNEEEAIPIFYQEILSVEPDLDADIEFCFVDDGSKDTSGDICDSYALSDSRIRVIHKENGGVSAARNAALDIASGEYITFCDADDYLEKECLETLYKNIEEK